MNEENSKPQNFADQTSESAASSEQLSKKERRRLKKERQHEKKDNERKQVRNKKFTRNFIITSITIGIIALVAWLLSLRTNLPSISMQGHIEQSPPSHIESRPIPVNIQKHMIEHADGTGRPGILIQYNCDDYECESDLIDKLVTIVQDFPEHVYLAPNNYDGKIILTKLGKNEVLDNFDEGKIRDFIN